MNLAATLFTPPNASPLERAGTGGSERAGGGGGLGVNGGMRNERGQAAFLRDLKRELARPLKQDDPASQRAERSEAREKLRAPSKGDAEGSTGEAAEAAGDEASNNAVESSAEGLDARADGGDGEGVASEGVGEATDVATGASTAGPARGAAEGETADGEPVTFDARARQEQAQASRAISVDRPMTIRELNEALAAVEPGAFSKELLRDLGLERGTTDAQPARPSDSGRRAPRGAQERVIGDAGRGAGDDVAVDDEAADRAAPDGLGEETVDDSALLSRAKQAKTMRDAGTSGNPRSDRETSAAASVSQPAVETRAQREVVASGTAPMVAAALTSEKSSRGADLGAKPGAATPPTIGRLERFDSVFASLKSGASNASTALARSEGAEPPPFAAQIGLGVKAAMDQGGEVTLHLRPEALGAMTVRVDAGESGVAVRFEVSEPATARLLDRSFDQLAEALSERGVTLDRATIEVRQAIDTSAQRASPADQPPDAEAHADRHAGQFGNQHSAPDGQERDTGQRRRSIQDSPRVAEALLGAPESDLIAVDHVTGQPATSLTLSWRLDTTV